MSGGYSRRDGGGRGERDCAWEGSAKCGSTTVQELELDCTESVVSLCVSE